MTSQDPITLEQLCQVFERRLRAGDEPRIEEFLSQVGESDQASLMRQLLKCEYNYRSQRGEKVDVDSYLSKYPAFESVIEETLAKLRDSQFDDTLIWSRSASSSTRGYDVQEADVGERFGRYELIEQIGKGGFGTVYRARDPQLDRDVALKFAHTGLLINDDEMQRFLREAKAVAQLRHPHIIPVHDAGELEGTYYIASDFIVGKTLRDVLEEENGGYSHRDGVEMIRKIATAIEFAHQKGIIHRDIKPENILIDEQGEPYIMDFGLARDIKDEDLRTKAGALMGTPAYMSPEQAKGEGHRAAPRSDLWSLGVILYEVLGGQRPFTGSTSKVIAQILEGAPPSLRSLGADIPRDLDTICERCLTKDSEDRLESCQELADELQRWLDGHPIQSRKTPWYERLRLWRGRNPLAANLALTAAALVVMAIGLLVVLANQGRERQKERDVRSAQSHFDAALSAGQRARWKEMLEELDEADKANFHDPILIELNRIRALDNLRLVRQRNRHIDALEKRADWGSHVGSVVLLLAERMLARGKHDEAIAQIRLGLDQEMTDAERAYANALLSETSAESIGFLRSALQNDPYHRSSVVLLGLELFAIGQRAEARERISAAMKVFPGDVDLAFLLSLLDTAEGKSPLAKSRLAEFRGSIDAETLKSLRAMLKVVEDIRTGVVRNSQADTKGAVLQVFSLFGRRSIRPDGLFQLRLPPRYRRLMNTLFSARVGAFLATDHSGLIKAFAKIEKAHPEGFVMLSRAVFLGRDGRWKEAEEVAAKAAETPSIFPETEQFAYLLAAGAASWVAIEGGMSPERNAKAVEYVRKRMALGPLSPQDAHRLAAVAWGGRENTLARQLVSQALAAQPSNQDFLLLAARIELDDKLFTRCLERTRQLLQVSPENETAIRLRDLALAGLRKALDEQKAKQKSGKK